MTTNYKELWFKLMSSSGKRVLKGYQNGPDEVLEDRMASLELSLKNNTD